MWKILILLFVLVAVDARPQPRRRPFVPGAHASTTVPFIVGGTPAPRGRWPWQLSLQFCGLGCSHTCGAVFLGGSRALTAAHCTDGRDGFEVIHGANSEDDMEGEVVVSRTNEHPNYIGGAPGIPFDVCTMNLASTPTGANTRAATLISSGGSAVGQECWISGWGRLSGDGGRLGAQLKEARVEAITAEDCNDRMPINIDDTDENHQCVWGGGSRGSCQGDSGGPLNCQVGGTWVVAGVTSWGLGNIFDSCLTTFPSVYANVATYRSWIDSN